MGGSDSGWALGCSLASVLLFMKRSSLFSCLFCLRAFYFGINDA